MIYIAKPLCFGEEYRPVKLSRHVYGIHDNGGNPFMFEKKLEWKLVNPLLSDAFEPRKSDVFFIS